jgi:hypothetical protein
MMRATSGPAVRRTRDGPTFDPSRERFRLNKVVERDCSVRDAEGATAPETLRQKDREGDELLESEAAAAASTEGVILGLIGPGEISQVP